MNDAPIVAFSAITPTTENYWRSVILFGRNVASYKLALANALLELADAGRDRATLIELAEPFSRHLCEHLKEADRQATSPNSRFLDACRAFNRGEQTPEQLIDSTVRLGFNNVIDAFHTVNQSEIPIKFFTDERRSSTKGVHFTDDLMALRANPLNADLPAEADARWRLVETAWNLGLPTYVLDVEYDPTSQLLIVQKGKQRRHVITQCREALNGYQKGRCFYCRRETVLGEVDIDHFHPYMLSHHNVALNIDGIWNLVLACAQCNRLEGGKFTHLPEIRFLERLHARNEYLISSHHPLRETLIGQTGATEKARATFLNKMWNDALAVLVHTWTPQNEIAAAL